MSANELRLFQGASLAAVLLLTLVAWLMLSRHDRLVFEKRRLEALEASERAALAQAEQSRKDAESARNEAEDALVARDVFLRTLAHDLKSPLASMAWQVQTLLRRARAGQFEPEQVQRELTSVAAQTAEAMAAIDELHDLTRAAAGTPLQLDCEYLDLAQEVRRVVASLPPGPLSDVRCEGEASGLIVNADRARLGRMLRNLIDNAIKYSPDGGDVVVWVGRGQAEDNRLWAEVQVRDHGLGIPETDLPHVFERYRRGSNVAHIDGEGLGLASVRHLAELHAGEVRVASQEGVGSTFTLRLPLVETPSPETPTPTETHTRALRDA
jgi:signal transduction histidine kinase